MPKTLYDPKRNDPASVAEFIANTKGVALIVQGDGSEEIIVPLNDEQRQTVLNALTWHHAKILASL